MTRDVLKYLQPNAVISIDMETTILLVNALKKALAEHAMQEVQRLGQEIEPDEIASILACQDMLDAQPVPPRTEQEPLVWPCLIDSADFSENTITLVMQCKDYKVSAGTHWLSTTQPKEKNT